MQSKSGRQSAKRLVAVFVLTLASSVIGLATYAAISPILRPVADGHYTGWSQNVPASGNFSLVNDDYCDGNGTYTYTNTLGNRESYQVSLDSVPPGSVIRTISITPCAANNLPGTISSTMKVFHRFNGFNSGDAPGSGYYLSFVGTTPSPFLSRTTFTGLSYLRTDDATLEIGAVFASGTLGIRLSNIFVTTTYDLPAVPEAPSRLTARNMIVPRSVQLSWSDNALYESGFKIERSDDGVTFRQIGTAGANATRYNTSVRNSGTYWYRVRAYNVSGNSAHTNVTSILIR